MKQIIKLFTLLSLASILLLAACGPTPPETKETEDTGETGETAVSATERNTDTTEGDLVTLYVGPELQECTGAGPQTCMMVKENPEDEYTYFYNQIEGFEYEEGYEYELIIQVTPVENPPADASSLKYSLVEIVSKTAVSTTDSETTSLDGTAWQLDSYAADGEMVETLPDTNFAFVDGQMAGMTGCNNTSAGYTTDGNAITFEMGMSTMMFCGEVENGQEDAVQANIAAAASYEISGDSMQMMDADGNVILQFSAINMDDAGADDATLEGTAWQLDSYAVDGEMVETLPDTTFAFADGQMIGMTGCNNTGAEYTTDGNNITFGLGVSTQMFCGEVENQQEQAIQANIAAVATYEISGNTMEMMDADGNIILQFSAMESASLTSNAWQLDSYAVDGAQVDATEGGVYTFTAKEGENPAQMDAHTGCNNISATYTEEGDAFYFGMGISTSKACGDAMAEQEQAIQVGLESTTSYQIEGDSLQMMDADGNVTLQFSALEAIALTDTLWQATGINNGTGGVTSVLAETTVTAVFATDNTLSGNASCNIYNTNYEASDGEMGINPSIITTRRACAEPITTQEGQYLTALAAVTSYKIIGDKLELRDADGSLQISYVAVPATPLVGTTWEATGVNNGTGGVVSMVSRSRVTAVFNEDSTLNGDSGCNSYFGSYEITGDNGLTIGGLGSTMMACLDNDVMAQEAAYNAALGTVASYTISDNKLELRTADGALAVSYVAAQVTPLADSEWDVISHNNGKGGVTTSIIGTQMTMNFDADGGVNGLAGCNNYFSRYEAGSELLSFGPIASTEMFCGEPEGVMDQEMEFLAALATVNTYHIDDGSMTLRDENGSIAAQLQIKGYIDPEILSILENATYSSEFTADQTVTLVDGQYQEEAAPGSASMTTVIFVDAGVGTIDDNYSAAVVLATNTGGSGTFISLHLIQFDNGEAMKVATTQLGDRTQINSVEINVDGEIVIDMVRHAADDPMCCPSEEVIVTYALVDGELVETSVVEMESAE